MIKSSQVALSPRRLHPMHVEGMKVVSPDTGIAVDVGGTKANFAIVDSDGLITEMWTCSTSGLEWRGVNDILIENIRNITSKKDVGYIGICIPGIVDKDGNLSWAPNIKSSVNIPLKSSLEHEFNIPTYITDDRVAAVIGEHAGNGEDDFIVLLIGTGIGAGIMCGGKPLRGVGGVAGAIGWNVQVSELGVITSVGLLEETVSGNGIGKKAAEINKKETSAKRDYEMTRFSNSREVFVAYDRGNKKAIKMLGKVVERLGVEIVNLVNTFNPSAVILNGTVGLEIASRFLDNLRDIVIGNAQPFAAKIVRLEASSIGELAFLHGAARGARELVSRQTERR